MNKISIISPVFENVNRISETMSSLIDFFKDKYEFEVMYYHTAELPQGLTEDPRFTFNKVDKKKSHDDCVTDGFQKATGDAVIVADLDNVNYQDYIRQLLIEWENKAQIVLLKKQAPKGFWHNIGSFFVKVGHCISNMFTGVVNLSKDFRAMRTFQLFARNVVEVINEFPEKNYYLRNFDCWVDFRVTIVYIDKKIKVKRKQKKSTADLWTSLVSTLLFAGVLVAMILLQGKVPEANRLMFNVLGVGLACVFFILALWGMVSYIVYRKTNLTRKFRKISK